MIVKVSRVRIDNKFFFKIFDSQFLKCSFPLLPVIQIILIFLFFVTCFGELNK